MGHWALDDAYFPVQQIDGLEQKLKDAKVKYEGHRYNAKHAFANETLKDPSAPIAYNAAAAQSAWTRTLAFFKQHLG
jgi:carboxymethylenebutenolidase